jgi:hypothetical protein
VAPGGSRREGEVIYSYELQASSYELKFGRVGVKIYKLIQACSLQLETKS